jgi:hypothetical protein
VEEAPLVASPVAMTQAAGQPVAMPQAEVEEAPVVAVPVAVPRRAGPAIPTLQQLQAAQVRQPEVWLRSYAVG